MAAGPRARKGVAMLEKDVKLDIHLSEDDSDTIAYAVLNLRGDHFESIGKARRNPADPPMPVIGEELAILLVLLISCLKGVIIIHIGAVL